ncbi:MAG: MerR family DNA-binding transcriptional regulator [Solirubrobacterales bacterium]|nr:MerR family DNA-binding transcriptional regulator [Solirubrobacterales bacterium]
MVRTNAAAKLLGVSPNTLRSWERRYGFPRPRRTPGGHRQYELQEIEALRQGLDETDSVSSAVSLARQRGLGPSSRSRLSGAFAAFDEVLVDRVLEESLSLRSVERTVAELLLPAVNDQAGPVYEFAWRHALTWLSAQRRLCPPAHHEGGVLILDPFAGGDPDTLHALAFELILRRSGVATLSLSPATELSRLGSALRRLRPWAVVLAGANGELDQMARLVWGIRTSVPALEVFDLRLDEGLLAAREALLLRLPHPAQASRQRPSALQA